MFWSIVFFAVVIYVLGLSSVLVVTGRPRMSIETHVLSTGVGLAAFAGLSVLLNTAGLPLAWWVFLVSALVLLGLGVLRSLLRAKPARGQPTGEPFWTRDSVALLVAAALALASGLVFLHGALATPWLEDDDSWVHATSAKYITVNHTYSISPEARAGVLSYLEPYPCGYPVLMGVLHQLNDSIFTTLKVFNILIISLGIIYFYLMAREWTARPAVALWATGVLWVMPCFMSRFIWAQSMSLVLFFPAFYALERTRREPAWAVVAAITIGGMFLAQPSAAAIFGLMALLYWVVNLVFALVGKREGFPRRTLIEQVCAGVGGLVLAALFYGPAYLKFGHKGFLSGMRLDPTAALSLKVSGTSTGQAYGIWDFLWSDAFRNKINQPTGLGPLLFLILVAGVTLLAARPGRLKENRWGVTALLWLVLTVLGLEGDVLRVSLFPHRFWAFFSIPAAMIAGEFFSFLASTVDWKDVMISVGLGLALGITLIFSGAAEAIQDVPRIDMEGARLGIFLIGVLGTIGGLLAGCLRLVQRARPGTWGRFFGLAALIAGVLLTSGYPKAVFEGSAQWPGGVYFYVATARTPSGELVPVQQHLLGYIEIHRRFVRNTPIFCVTGTDDHVIGFDMYSPPYDLELKRLRNDLEKMSPTDIDDRVLRRILDTARRKHFQYVLLDPCWAADIEFNLNNWRRRLGELVRQAAITETRLQELFASGALPTEEEKPFLAPIRECLDYQRRLTEAEQNAMAKVGRLRQMMTTSADLSPVMDSGPFGLAVFALHPK